MKGVQSIYDNSHTFSFLVVALMLFHPVLSISVSTLSSSESLTISSNRTLVSTGGVFELGFFKPSSRSHWYLGIWYKEASEKTYVWVANRDDPLPTSTGTLIISRNNLVLLGQYNNTFWSTNLGSGDAPVIAEIISNGNFVLRHSNNNDDDPSGFLWQSFDSPTDTLLPEMKLGYDYKTGRNRFLTSWRHSDDPRSGNVTYKIHNLRKLPEIFLMDRDLIMQRSGPLDGLRFSGIPEEQGLYYNYKETNEEVSFSFQMTNQSIYSRLAIRDSTLERFTLIPPSRGWSLSWDLTREACELYSLCGANAYCEKNLSSSHCYCLKGFVPKNQAHWGLGVWSSGCVRRTQLSCERRDHAFLQLNNSKFPDAKTATVDWGINVKKCEERCLSDCNCTSFASIRRGGIIGCVIWTGELFDLRTYISGGQIIYVKTSAIDPDFSSGEKRDQTGKIIGWSFGGVSVMLILSVIVFCFWKKKQKQAKANATPIVCQGGNQVLMNEMVLPRNKRSLSGEDEIEDLELPSMEFEAVVAATENFSDSNKVGKGGFGVVYKGRLIDGQEIAVKRLSEMSDQGTDEFMTEARLIARLQHINLVRLIGCCVYEAEKILIYEFLDNLSLDSHLFDEARSCLLNWQMRFNIISGIARGLLYLHQDSRFRIIHRDLKASNVLLDKDMTPKISDFGMARIFGWDETEANTRKVVGTYGYMSPEYAMNGTFSMKSDVFSFGVLLLEIISGKRNRGFCDLDSNLNLHGYVWKHWKEDQGLKIVDTAVIVDSSSSTFRPREILRCLQISLLCVQDCVEDRPLMSSVVLMLGSEAVVIPQPKQPHYCVASSSCLDTWSNRRDDEATVNQITTSIIDAR
ncbi:Serine-threonine/tyrosine-protein kinase [Hirschfeldia incana]|nr:Serine-threonine/tyrosine-protein kinase [Hirschfeldia incana]KAJ0252997.1 Serine-threonine/tyrosine-protein kinase [Hirschfeldia incana]